MELRRTVPNGGWGWMVVIGSSIINLVNQSLFSTFGLIYGDKLKEMGYGTFEAALVMNISSMIMNFSGLITGPILKTYSYRKIALVGVSLTSTGILLSSFTTNIVHLILSYSILTGLGFGLIMPSTFVAVNEYFTTRKTQAVGLAMAGTGIGQMLMPQVVRFLLDEYGFRGTTIVLAGLCLNGIPGALLFQPVKWHTVIANEQNEETQPLLTVKKTQLKNNSDDTNNNIKNKAPLKSGKTWLSTLANLLDLNLLKDFTFIHLLFGLSLVYTCCVAFNMLLPFFLQESVGLNRANTAVVMSVLSGADILSRITLPLLTKKFNINCKMTFLFGTLFLACFRSLLAEQTSFLVILSIVIFCGYARASVVINQNLTISEYCIDQSKLPGALGLNMVAKGLTVLTVGQLIGWFRDYFQSFSICIHIQNAIMLTVVLSWSCEIFGRKLLKNSSTTYVTLSA